MSKPASFTEVIDLWPTRGALQADLEALTEPGSKTPHARSWATRNSIPVVFFDAIIVAAVARGYPGVTYALLTEIRKAKKENG